MGETISQWNIRTILMTRYSTLSGIVDHHCLNFLFLANAEQLIVMIILGHVIEKSGCIVYYKVTCFIYNIGSHISEVSGNTFQNMYHQNVWSQLCLKINSGFREECFTMDERWTTGMQMGPSFEGQTR